jgi:hypothetical protein
LRELESNHGYLVLSHLLRRAAVRGVVGPAVATSVMTYTGCWSGAPLIVNLQAARHFLLAAAGHALPCAREEGLHAVKAALVAVDPVQQAYNRAR